MTILAELETRRVSGYNGRAMHTTLILHHRTDSKHHVRFGVINKPPKNLHFGLLNNVRNIDSLSGAIPKEHMRWSDVRRALGMTNVNYDELRIDQYQPSPEYNPPQLKIHLWADFTLPMEHYEKLFNQRALKDFK